MLIKGESMLWKNKKKTFAVKLDCYLGRTYGCISLLPNIIVYYSHDDSGTVIAINLSLFVGEVQFWFGDVSELI